MALRQKDKMAGIDGQGWRLYSCIRKLTFPSSEERYRNSLFDNKCLEAAK
jgi:hypothetical protein